MVSVSNVSLALIAASTALISAVQANQYASLADWKKTSYYKEACDKKFLPPSSIPSSSSDDSASASGSASTTGEFSMAAGSGDSTFLAEEKKRFEQALADIEELQKLHPHATFSLNTPFALMSHDEFLAYVNRNNINPDLNPLHPSATASSSSGSSNSSVPMTGAGAIGSTTSASGVDGGPKTGAAAAGETVDWQQQGCVTAVKDQAQCGACWAFSATAAMESGVCVETSGASLPVLADQELISCDNQGQSQGCGGGFASYTMDWIAQSRAGKMCTLASYPFASSDGSVPSCKLSSCSEVDIGVTGFLSIRKDPGALEDAVRSRPVSVFLYSGSKAFQYYSGGILTGENCDKTGAHSGLAVGFGEENGTPYWRVKNQWGTNWGEAGYVRIQRRYAADDEGACGVELYASYPTFKSGVTAAPTAAPTVAPTAAPTVAPTSTPTTAAPTAAPTTAPTVAPTSTPATAAPTAAPTTIAPTAAPTVAPTTAPTAAPTAAPTQAPTPASTTAAPTQAPIQAPTKAPAPVATPASTKVSTSVPTPAQVQSQVELPTPAPTNAQTAAPAITAPPPVETNPFLAPVLPDPYQGEAPTPAPTTMAGGDAAASGSFQEGVDFLGNDIFNSSASSVSECSTLCKATAGCNAFTFTKWKSGWCWQKSRAGLVVPNTDAVSGSFHDISKCTRQNTPQEYGYEYPGNDLSEVAASKADDCYALCSDVAQCHAFTWSKKNGGTCALKTRKVPAATYHAPTDSKEFVSAIVYKCKQIEFNSDFEGQDIGNAPARSPEACCALCHAVKGCVGFAWNAFEAGTCWFKSGTANKVTKGNVVAASI